MNEDLFDASMLITNGKLPMVRDIIDEMEIYRFYAPDLRMGTQKSPLRLEIKSPSFGLYEKHGKINYKDHSEGDQGDIYDFVIAWYRVYKQQEISIHNINKVIYYDMHLGGNETVQSELFFNDDHVGPIQRKSAKNERWQLQVKDIGWTEWALDYWIKCYNIAPSILKSYKCGHAKEVWATPPGRKTYLWGVSTKENPIYYFYFPRTGHIKCYRPKEKSKKKKWIMNCDNETDVQGYDQMKIKLTRPKLVIFTKAMKECMFYRSYHLDAIAIHGESHNFTEDFIRHIKKYSTYQLGIYDNDYPGKRAAVRFRQRHGIEQFLIKEAKNITDLWEKDAHRAEHYIDLLKTTYGI